MKTNFLYDVDYTLLRVIDVVTLDEPIQLSIAKKWLRIEDAETQDDNEIQSLIVRARQYGEDISRRSFALQTWQLILNGGFPSEGIQLPMGPVRGITSLKYWYNSSLQTLNPSLYVFEPLTGIVEYVESWPDTDDRTGNVQIVYTTGHTANDLPKPLIDAMLQYITWSYTNKLPTGDEPTWLKKLFKMYRRY